MHEYFLTRDEFQNYFGTSFSEAYDKIIISIHKCFVILCQMEIHHVD